MDYHEHSRPYLAISSIIGRRICANGTMPQERETHFEK